MRIVYAGSPAFSVPALARLLESGAEIVAVVTQPDAEVGRKRVLTPTPVKSFALERGLKVLDFIKIREHEKELKELNADIMITCAYGQILTRGVLDCFKGGVWNLHASLLPKYRGASPIQSAILGGESHTGITVMKTELELDSGAILLVKRCEIGEDTCGELTERLSLLAADAAVEGVELLKRGQTQLLMQDEARVTFCKKVQKSDAKIDFNLPAERVKRAVKAFSPQPAAFCNWCGNILNILDCETSEFSGNAGEIIYCDRAHGIVVACGEGAIKITKLQPAGGKVLSAADFINGRKLKAGDRLD